MLNITADEVQTDKEQLIPVYCFSVRRSRG